MLTAFTALTISVYQEDAPVQDESYDTSEAAHAQRRGSYGAGVTQATEFDCPEEFGYYPHPSDCTQYYVCVFGGALLESCTGGLMYSMLTLLLGDV
ncbi:hypothetical protein FOCC_FOCC008624 [Frankliniella occidentalis]|nr:hypothetical protein FOCC_FOCC008624 [Frankliniella occidentalis]